ncbi:hypothetical protein HMPREF1981_01636 [Bacteroides pyogenes F0041]|uniref:DUF7688 domain-containing protein n=2 Tax=Bacteroides pyogenes TaxID=310300 RepID=U2C4Q6_9BACE|nr:hypothetical protein HMPREF1981_01636 [Bacteroides pyogenes F0041]
MDVTVHKDISDKSSLGNSVAVMDEIRQDGETILSSSDGISIPMIFRNLSGKNFSGKEYSNYLKHVAYDDMGFVPGTITLWHGGRLVAKAKLEKIN